MSHKVAWPLPLERVTPFYPGQMGVPGSDARLGIRSSCNGAVFYVDRNNGNASDNSDGTDPLAPLSTVQAGINKCAAFSGDTVAVMANNSWQYGTYLSGRVLPVAEEVVIDTPGIRLVGVAPSGVNGVPWQPTADRTTLITVRALDVLIEGFLFTGGAFISPTAICAYWDGGAIKGDNLVVRNCVFESEVNTGIELRYVWYADIYENVFWFNGGYGIWANPGYDSPSNLQIHDNIFHDCAKAMSLVNVDYSHIFRNQIYNHDAAMGINATDDGINLLNGRDNLICGNWFSCLKARWNDLNSPGTGSAWVDNMMIDGPNTANPT
jgi:hypothetical protein